ncbi:hypothetical protein PMAYCL1PPCAC_27371, partial [Pristionchus mayeri]
LLDELKPLFETIDLETTRLPQISNQNDIHSLSSRMVTTIGDAEEIITNYTGIVRTIKERIEEMGKKIEGKERAEKEGEHLEEVQLGIHGSSNLPLNAVSLTSLLNSKESKYENTLNRSIRRVRAVSILSHLRPIKTHSPCNHPLPPKLLSHSQRPLTKGEIAVASITLNSSLLSPHLLSTLTQSLPPLDSVSHRPSLSLPPIRLETFDGSDITRWSAFKYQIESLIINQPHLSEVEKIFHIRSNLKGEAHSLIASLPVQPSFLTKMLTRLESEYDRYDLTQARLMQSLRSIRAKSSRVDDQLSAVRAMINIAHSIHGDSGINALCMQQQLAEMDPISRIYETTEKEERKLADELVTKHFNDTVQSHDDGYYVQYAMKPDAKDTLPDNYNLAVSRLSSTHQDFIESCFDSLHSELYKSREEIKSLKEDLNYLKAHVSNESKIIKNELGSMSLSLSAILSNTTQPSPNHSHSISTPHTPRISIAPRSQFRTPNSLDRPTHSRDRSRSPIAPRTNPISKPSHIAQTVKCTFCNSTIHYSRNCSHVTSISTRLSLMAPNQCLRCFRIKNAAHSASCEPDVCVRGCKDEQGRGLRHQ